MRSLPTSASSTSPCSIPAPLRRRPPRLLVTLVLLLVFPCCSGCCLGYNSSPATRPLPLNTPQLVQNDSMASSSSYPSTSRLIAPCSMTSASSNARMLLTCCTSKDCVSCCWAPRSLSAARSDSRTGGGLVAVGNDCVSSYIQRCRARNQSKTNTKP